MFRNIPIGRYRFEFERRSCNLCVIIFFYYFVKRMLFKIISFDITKQMVWKNGTCETERSTICEIDSLHVKYRISFLKMQQTCFFAGTYCLLDYYTGVQNVLEGMAIAGKRRDLDSAYEILEKMGIRRDTADQNVKELSGGQKQRVAIARAVACQARIILADEPTGTLDEDTAGEIIELFQKLVHEEGICVIVVTHMRMLAEKADDVIRLEKKSFFTS